MSHLKRQWRLNYRHWSCSD